MKKLLTILGAVAVTASSATAVVACGSGEKANKETNVIFMVPGKTTSQTGKIAKAYEELVNDFNAQNDSKVKVEFKWKKEDPISQDIAAGKALPDLYIAYPDLVSANSMGRAKDKIRDMEASLAQEGIKEEFLKESFYNEGVVNGKLAVLPAAKSVDFTAVNMKLFVELISTVAEGGLDNVAVEKLMTNIDEYNKDREIGLNTAQKIEGGDLSTSVVKMKTRFEAPTKNKEGKFDYTTGKTGKVFKDNAIESVGEEIKDEFITEVLNVITETPTIETMRTILKSNEKMLVITKFYNALYNFNGKTSNFNTTQITDMVSGFAEGQAYAFGIDDLANKFYMQAAKDDKNPSIDVTDVEKSPSFLYHLENVDKEARSGDVFINSKGSTKTVLDYLDQVAKIAEPNRGLADQRAKWRGTMMPGRMDNAYSSTYFAQGTMLTTASSSAGTWSMPSNVSLQQDLLASSGSTSGTDFGEDFKADYFMEQGPGIAGFKSTGKNADEKEKVVTAFLQYTMQETSLTKLALQSGYMPSTKKATERFGHYVDGTFNNATGAWMDDSKKPTEGPEYVQYTEAKSSNKFSKFDVFLADLVNNFLQGEGTQNTNLVTSVANPLGQVMRDAISNSIKSTVVQGDASKHFIGVLANKTGNGTILGQAETNKPGELKKFEIKMK
ncbi:lipoprotein [[Acholeplasma] multilocale]|uniref:lipoprotein n=1 Tax=[Acholeplasma] multilocale TaxID=264638 RepID=UPI00047EB39B|nr:lipoprotein [[Acholeplasma] multilocale]